MTLTFIFPVGCFVCGYRNVGVDTWFRARVNKNSIRAEQSLTAVPHHCRECGWPTSDSFKPRYRPDEESLQKITEARRRKGWVTA